MSISVILDWVAALNTVAKAGISGINHLVLFGDKSECLKALIELPPRQESFPTPIVSSASSAILEAHHLQVKDTTFYSSSLI